MRITRKEKKELFKKLTSMIKARLLYLKSTELTYTEITERTGLTLSRISEVVNDRKDVNEILLVKLLIGGIVNSNDFLSVAGLTESQESYLKGLVIYEDADLRDEVARLKSLGENPAGILRDFRKDKYGEVK